MRKVLLVILTVALIAVLVLITRIKNASSINEWQVDPFKTDMEMSRATLITFFDRLSEKRYTEATKYSGFGYDILEEWNPNVEKTDHALLMKYGCEINGLQCLKIRKVLTQQQVSPAEFEFTVQFTNDDGSLFERGPCCGADNEEPIQTDFTYIVKKIGDNFLVLTSPVHIS